MSNKCRYRLRHKIKLRAQAAEIEDFVVPSFITLFAFNNGSSYNMLINSKKSRFFVSFKITTVKTCFLRLSSPFHQPDFAIENMNK